MSSLPQYHVTMLCGLWGQHQTTLTISLNESMVHWWSYMSGLHRQQIFGQMHAYSLQHLLWVWLLQSASHQRAWWWKFHCGDHLQSYKTDEYVNIINQSIKSNSSYSLIVHFHLFLQNFKLVMTLQDDPIVFGTKVCQVWVVFLTVAPFFKV